MPNHCECDLTVSGSIVDRRYFINGIDKKDGILRTYFPIPKAFTIGESWYDWCVSNWGTKWGDYELEIVERKQTHFLSFRSAWSPPIAGMVVVSKMFPKLTFKMKFYECGAQYKGIAKIKNGVNILEEFSKYRGNRGG